MSNRMGMSVMRVSNGCNEGDWGEWHTRVHSRLISHSLHSTYIHSHVYNRLINLI